MEKTPDLDKHHQYPWEHSLSTIHPSYTTLTSLETPQKNERKANTPITNVTFPDNAKDK